ncbi:hypothetical protein ES703_78901 [subsurface metagenome]
MKKILVGMVLVFFVLIAWNGNVYGEKLIRVKGIYWDSKLDGDVKASTKLVAGTDLDLTSTLDLDESAYIPEIELKINIPYPRQVVVVYGGDSRKGFLALYPKHRNLNQSAPH